MSTSKAVSTTFPMSEHARNRLCLPLGRDLYLESSRHWLGEAGIRYSRVPDRPEGVVYYFFKDVRDMASFIDHLKELAQL
jgi:hypothetical protein